MSVKPHSVRFIVPRSSEEGAGFEVTHEALEILGKIKTPVAPIAVVGKYRTGKSFLLNKLINTTAGFEVGPTVEACTKGIWLWSEPSYVLLPDGTTVAVLFCDTEGIGAAGATAEHDARIFSLATLLCSVLVYNSVGSIDEEAVQSLSFVANLTKHIQLKSGAGGAESAVAEGAELEDAASEDSGDDAPLQQHTTSPSKRHSATAKQEAHTRPSATRRPVDSDDDGEGEEGDDGISALLGVTPNNTNNINGTPNGFSTTKSGTNTPASAASTSRGSVVSSSKGSGLSTAKAAGGDSKKGHRSKGSRGSSLLGFFKKDINNSNHTGSASRDSDESGEEDAETEYINELKKTQRKKRAAAKRALAQRLREEARRAGGLRREAALLGSKDAVHMTADDAEVSTFFPSFLWVLRDFTLDLVGDDGLPLTARDYLEDCLAQQEGFSTDAQTRNRTRRVLTSFFKDRECATLVRPLEDEAKLQMIDALPETALRVEFRKQIAELKTKLFEELLRPKTMQGQFVTGRMLAGLAQAYVGAINARAVPSIGNAWDGVTRVECKDALDNAYTVYSQGMELDAPRPSLPMSEEGLRCAHEKNRIAALDDYESKAVGPVAEKYRQELKARIAEEWSELCRANASQSDSVCTRIITRIWHAVVEPKLMLTTEMKSSLATSSIPTADASTNASEVYHDYEAFKTDLDKVTRDYFAEARGPAVHRVLSAFLIEALPTTVRAINAAREAESEKRCANLQHALTSAKRDLEAATTRSEVLDAQCKDLRQERQSSAIEKARAEQEVKFVREERVRLEAKINDLETEISALSEKLKQERLAHAQARVALRTGAASETKSTTPSGGEGRWASPTSRPSRGSIDMRAIMGEDQPDGPLAGRRTASRDMSTLRMKPKGGETIAMPTHVEFPQPQAGNSCGPGCVIQ